MKTQPPLLVLALAAWSSISLAGDARGVVGTATIEMENKANARKIVSELWFVAAGDAKVENFSPRPPLRAIAIARNAVPQPTTGKRPLIVVSHGNWGSRYSQGWLALELARAGYLVLSTSHPGTVGDDQSAAGRYRLWDRSRDVSFAIDEVLQKPHWAERIDESRIGFVGHSFGGWTGVSLAGGRFDPQLQRASCEKAQKKDFYCEGTLKDDIAGVPAQDATESFKDPRIKAFYIMGSGPAQGFSAESLTSINVPFIVDTAQYDEILNPEINSTALARQITGAKEIKRPVGHFAYVPECRWLVGRMLASQICSDPDGVDRGRVHKEVARDVVEFFNTHFARN